MRDDLPPEPWELEYPYRESDFGVRRGCADLRAAALRRAGTQTSDSVATEAPEDLLARTQISAAYQLERRARAYMAGRQFTGVQTHKRGVLVDDALTANSVRQAWLAGERTPEVQVWVDRAVGCLKQCLDHGMVVLEWDRPGYDDVTYAFEALLPFASVPGATPVVLDWEEAYLGEPPPPPRQVFYAPYKEPLHYTVGLWLIKAMMAGLAIVFVGGLGHVIWTSPGCREARRPPPEAVPCPVQLQRIRDELGPAASHPRGDDPERRAEAFALVEAGDLNGAKAVLDGSPVISVAIVGTSIFLYQVECVR